MADYVVTNLNSTGTGSFLYAIESTSSGDTITFSVSGTIDVPFTLSINSGVTIDGGNQITLSGQGTRTVFDTLSPSQTNTIENLTIINGADSPTFAYKSGAGAILNAGTLTLIDDTFTNNTANELKSAGAVLNEAGGNLTIIGSTFTHDTATAAGSNPAAGAVLNLGTASVSSSYFANDSATGATGQYGAPESGGGGQPGGSAAGGVFNVGGSLTYSSLTFGPGMSATGGSGGPGGGFYGGGSGGAGGAGGQSGGAPAQSGHDGSGFGMVPGGSGGAPGQPGTGGAGGGGGGGGGLAYADIGGDTCFLRGTHILTPAGEVAVEDLRAGDLVLTPMNGARPIRWIGVGHVVAPRGRRTAATPVIVRKGAIADNVPNQDLRITKAHSLYIDGVLIPMEFLVNHRSILWDDHAQEVSIYHIELETHDLLLANGAPAESYRDDGNRWLFQNANSSWCLPPQEPCMPVLTGGSVVDAVWRRLLDRSGPRGTLPLTDDPDLHLLVNGIRLNAVRSFDGMHVFNLSAPVDPVRIVSRAAIPQELGLARDPRPLGVALRQIMVTQGVRMRTIEAEDERLTEGFHGFETELGIRWTNGDSVVPVDLFDGLSGVLQVTLRLGGSTSYLEDSAQQRVA